MKKASEVFELPLTAVGDFIVEKTGNRCAEFDLHEQAELAANAIKNADALAEALGLIVMSAEDKAFECWIDKNHPSGDVSEVQCKFERSSEFKDFINEFGKAKAALAAYRGEL